MNVLGICRGMCNDLTALNLQSADKRISATVKLAEVTNFANVEDFHEICRFCATARRATVGTS